MALVKVAATRMFDRSAGIRFLSLSSRRDSSRACISPAITATACDECGRTSNMCVSLSCSRSHDSSPLSVLYQTPRYMFLNLYQD